MDFKQKTLTALFILHGLLWVLIGLLFIKMRGTFLVPFLMWANAAFLFGFALNVAKRVRAIYYISVFYVGLNLTLTITDQFGSIDLMVLTINAITLVLLYLTRKYFLNEKSPSS
jgi:hypothetical protein